MDSRKSRRKDHDKSVDSDRLMKILSDASVKVQITGPGVEGIVSPQVTPSGDGAFTLKFDAPKPGQFFVLVTLSGGSGSASVSDSGSGKSSSRHGSRREPVPGSDGEDERAARRHRRRKEKESADEKRSASPAAALDPVAEKSPPPPPASAAPRVPGAAVAPGRAAARVDMGQISAARRSLAAAPAPGPARVPGTSTLAAPPPMPPEPDTFKSPRMDSRGPTPMDGGPVRLGQAARGPGGAGALRSQSVRERPTPSGPASNTGADPARPAFRRANSSSNATGPARGPPPGGPSAAAGRRPPAAARGAPLPASARPGGGGRPVPHYKQLKNRGGGTAPPGAPGLGARRPNGAAGSGPGRVGGAFGGFRALVSRNDTGFRRRPLPVPGGGRGPPRPLPGRPGTGVISLSTVVSAGRGRGRALPAPSRGASRPEPTLADSGGLVSPRATAAAAGVSAAALKKHRHVRTLSSVPAESSRKPPPTPATTAPPIPTTAPPPVGGGGAAAPPAIPSLPDTKEPTPAVTVEPAAKPVKRDPSAMDLSDLERAVAAAPEDHELLHALGVALAQAANRPVDGIARLKEALKLAPDQAQYHGDLGLAYYKLADYQAGADALRRAVDLDATKPDLLVNLANCLRHVGNDTQAVVHYEAAIALKPTMALAHLNYGNALRKLNRPDEASRAFQQALTHGGPALGEADVRVRLGEALEESGDLAGSEREFRAALQADKQCQAAHEALASLLERGGDLDRALDHWRSACALEPESVALCTSVGQLTAELGDHEAATPFLQRAIAAAAAAGKPWHAASAHNHLGLCLRMTTADPNDPASLDQSKLHFQQAVDFTEGDVAPDGGADVDADVDDDEGDLEERRAARKAVRASALANLAYVQDDQGDHEQAAANYRLALAIDADNPSTLNKLGACLTHLSDLPGAIETYERALVANGGPDTTICYNLAAAHANNQNLDSAIAACSQALEADPEFQPAQEMLQALKQFKGGS